MRSPRAGAHAFDLIPLAAVAGAERADVQHGPFGHHLRAAAFGEVQVVLDERVLGAVGAAHHAAPAQLAAGALGALAVEEGVGHGLAGLALLAEVDPDGGLFVGVGDAEVLAELAQQLVGGVVVGVLHDPEHPLRLGVVGRELALPLCHLRPLAVFEELGGGDVEGVGVAKAAAAHAAAGDDGDVAEDRQAEDALHPQVWAPGVAAHVGGVLGELVVGKAPPALQHPDAVALLGEAQRGDAAAEARADHEPVVVVAAPHAPIVLVARPTGHYRYIP